MLAGQDAGYVDHRDFLPFLTSVLEFDAKPVSSVVFPRQLLQVHVCPGKIHFSLGQENILILRLD